MRKKILAVLLIALIAVFALTACKSGESGTAGGDGKTTAAAEAADNTEKGGGKTDAKESESGEKQTTAKGGNSEKESADSQNGSGKSGETTAAGGSGKSQKSTTKASESKTDGWKQKEAGTVVKGDVSVNVVKYGSATVDEGEELIQQLAKGGLKNAKKLASNKTKSTVVYDYSGQRIGSDKTEFIRFEFTVQKGTGYLVTVIAEKQAGLDTDISYIMSNLAKLAK